MFICCPEIADRRPTYLFTVSNESVLLVLVRFDA